jgi:hypothetical protein
MSKLTPHRDEIRLRLERVLKNARSMLSVVEGGTTLQTEAMHDDLNWLDDTLVELEREPNLLEIANEVTGAGGARREAYGHPIVDFTCTAALVSAVLARQSKAPKAAFTFTGALPAELVPLLMICVKLSRLSGQIDHADSALDLAGYARTLEMVWEKRREAL